MAKTTYVELPLTLRLPKNDLEVLVHLARKKHKSLKSYIAASATSTLTADVDELYDPKSPTYRKLMTKLGVRKE